MGEILIACEESQVVTIELRKLGLEAYSCDIQPCSGGHPEWHLQEDVIPLLKEKWDMIIAFPPCTHLAVSGACWFDEKIKDGRQQKAIDFFMLFANSDCDKVVIENPINIMSTIWRKPNQIIQPWQFGDPYEKKTALWLKGVFPLLKTKIVKPPERIKYKSGNTMPEWYAKLWGLPQKERSKLRSKTFPGIAKAMAEQWGGVLNGKAKIPKGYLF
jgi:hypothetical protein